MKNRWGKDINIGDRVKAHGANTTIEGVVTGFQTTGAYVRAYGVQAVLDGITVGLDDVFDVQHKEKESQ